jgi:NADPH:quinone reductase-like Zn-dependent oxidoreductase
VASWSQSSAPSDEKAKELGIRCAFVFVDQNVYVLEQPAKLIEHGKLRPIVGAELALHDIAKAHALSETGHAVGKIVLYVGQP